MSKVPWIKTLTISSAALVPCWTAAAADTMSASGAPPGHESRPAGPAPSLPVGLDDTLSPITDLDPGSAPMDAVPCDLETGGESQPACVPCWEFLAGIAPQDRGAAAIEIELLARDNARDLPVAEEIAGLWNGGRPAEAVGALRRFEEAGTRAAVGVSWGEDGAPGGPRSGVADVRIGAPRDDARFVNVDHDAQTGHLFSVVGWGSLTSTAY